MTVHYNTEATSPPPAHTRARTRATPYRDQHSGLTRGRPATERRRFQPARGYRARTATRKDVTPRDEKIHTRGDGGRERTHRLTRDDGAPRAHSRYVRRATRRRPRARRRRPGAQAGGARRGGALSGRARSGSLERIPSEQTPMDSSTRLRHAPRSRRRAPSRARRL